MSERGNPFFERKEQIAKWRAYATEDIQEENEILIMAGMLREKGIKKIDALHISCAIYAKAAFFLTTDDGILKNTALIQDINITDPIGFIKEVLI